MAPGNGLTTASGSNGGSLPVQPKPLFGGNIGKKQRADGLKAGSPEAIAADKAKNAERMRRARAEKAAATPPPPLPAAGGSVPPGPAPGASGPGEAAPPPGVVVG